MAASFNDLLNDHLHYDLLKEKIEEKNYLWKTLEHDDEVAGDIIVPFEASRASTVKAGGGPTAIAGINKHTYTRGSVSFANIPKMWGSLIFNYEDILNHEGRVKAKSFLGTFLPKQIEDFTGYFANQINHMVLNKAQKDTVAVTGTAPGVLGVYRPERYEIGEKLILDPAGANLTVYVRTIDMNTTDNTGAITCYDAVTGGSAVDVSGVAAGELIYKDGFQTAANQMTSIRDALLTSGNGGDTNIHGVAKTASKYTQAVNVSGASMNANTVLSVIFDALAVFKRKNKTGASEIWASTKHQAAVMKKLEQDKGPYKAVPGSTKTSEYGFTEIKIFGPSTGEIKFVFMQDLDDDCIFVVDPKSMKFHSVKGVQKVKSPDGNYYTVSRDATNGFDFVTDLYYRGDLIISEPYKNMVLHSISY
jgi:hypothetical protein